MATAQEIADLRAMINQPESVSPYTDEALDLRIDAAAGSLYLVAVAIWTEKAGAFSALVDVQEGSSKRSLGSLSANALKMASYYQASADGGGDVIPFRAARTRAIERP